MGGLSAISEQPTPEQQAIIEAQSGPILVLAGVGSGKTLTLAHRLAFAIEQGTSARSTLAITFTNRAAQEMRERVVALVGDRAAESAIQTFHAFCARVLRRAGKWLALSPDFVVWDEEDAREAVRLAANGLHMPLDEKSLVRTQEELSRLKSRGIYPQNWKRQETELLRLFRAYQHVLETSNALDFDDLVAQTWTLFKTSPVALQEWADRFPWVEVDEFQDTADLEYGVLHLLTTGHQNLCVYADLDQWIYQWRGVNGPKIIDRFRRDFPGYRELHLSENFRSTRNILKAATEVISRGGSVRGQPETDSDGPPSLPLPPRGGGVERGADKPIRVHGCDSETAELRYIGRRVRQIHDRMATPWSRIAVLTRTNERAVQIAEFLDTAQVPNLTIAAKEFFRRTEIKDLMAYLRLVADRYDGLALRRIANVPPRGLTPRLLERVEQEGRSCGLLLTDMVDEACLRRGDPCEYEIEVARRQYVALDVEATGLDPREDQLVEIAAIHVDAPSGQRRDFHALLRPTRPVGASEAKHGYSDTFLAENGQNPARALAEFRTFVGDLPLVGHNVAAYDVPMINSGFERAGLRELRNRTVDTLPLARRALDLDRYNLDRVRLKLGVATLATHHARDDAACAEACFRALTEILSQTRDQRRALVERARDRFAPLARLVGGWRARAATSQLSEMIDQIVTQTGYGEQLRRGGEEGRQRLARLRQLRDIAAERFDPLPSLRSLQDFLEYASLARSADRFSREENKVPILTIHTAKGLEFEAVIIASAHDGAIPLHPNRSKPEQLEEERRLLYVGMTRAKGLLELSYPLTSQNPYGRLLQQTPSRFLADAPAGTFVYTHETGGITGIGIPASALISVPRVSPPGLL